MPVAQTRFSWRDRLLLFNSVLFCLVGCGLIIRYALGQISWLGVILGLVFAAYGGYRLWRVRRVLQGRVGDHHGE
jgi:EamA domain-containing membrane protein RarD